MRESPYDILNYYYNRPEQLTDPRKGEIYGQDLLLVKDGVPTFIDFTNSNNNQNAPTMRIAGPLYSLVVYNIGPGLVYHSVNMTSTEGGTAALPAGVQPRVYTSTSREPLFKTINLRAVGADATVNLTMEL